ncbi:MAG: zinc ribbon domain-containing protein [Spirochaetales bacterium]
MALINCPECKKEISDHVEACPYCGYPLKKEAAKENEVQKSGKAKKLVISILIAVIVICSAGYAYINYSNTQYAKNSKEISFKMLMSAGEAESICNLVIEVWQNSIYKKYSSNTDKYTRSSSGFYDDFNTSLNKLYNASEFEGKVETLKTSQNEVDKIFLLLKNPNKKNEKVFDTLNELYTTYSSLINLAISPSGSLTTYTNNKNDKVEKYLENSNKLKNLLPE